MTRQVQFCNSLKIICSGMLSICQLLNYIPFLLSFVAQLVYIYEENCVGSLILIGNYVTVSPLFCVSFPCWEGVDSVFLICKIIWFSVTKWQESLSSLAAEYESGSPILLEKIKVCHPFLSVFPCTLCIHLLLILFLGPLSYYPSCRCLMNNILLFDVPGETGTASFGVLCFHTLYVLISLFVYIWLFLSSWKVKFYG